jgi:hypothetical protein
MARNQYFSYRVCVYFMTTISLWTSVHIKRQHAAGPNEAKPPLFFC